MEIKANQKPLGPVDLACDQIDHFKYVVIPTDAIGVVGPVWVGGEITNGARNDVVNLTVKIRAIKGANKILIVEE